MECLRLPTLELLAPTRPAPNEDDFEEPQSWPQSVWPAVPPPPVYRVPHKREFPAAASAPRRTRQSLLAQRLVIVFSAAGALRRRQLAIGSPGEQPSLHVLVA